MSLTQGGALPSIDTTQTQSTNAPQFYTDYLNNLAQAGTAGGNAQYVGATPLQNQAFSQVQSNVGNYQPTLDMAQGYLGNVGNYDPTQASAGALNMALGQNAVSAAQPYIASAANPAYNTVQNYMNPYVNNVVSQIGDLAEQNIMNNVAPQTSAGLVGSGQFGSQRGAQALANTLGQYGQQTTAQQVGALNTGYNNAMNQAQTGAALQGLLGSTMGQLTNTMQANQANIGNIQGNMASQEQQNLINAAATGGNLAAQTQQLGMNDVNALATLGGQQQQIAQNQQLFPLQTAAAQANILRGYTIPTAVSNTYSGPIPGAYQSSPLSQISGIGALLGSTQGQTLMKGIGGLFGAGSGNGGNGAVPSNLTNGALQTEAAYEAGLPPG